jgi:drug/metabolite transporter (DMT)-like permease
MLNAVLVGILFAAVAMVLNSCGALLQAEGARRATRARPAAIQPRYLAGMFLVLVGWGCAVMALRVLPVFAVQAVIGGTIALTAVVGARLIGARLPIATRLAVAACLAGLVLVAASAGSEQPPVHRPGVDVVLLASLLLLAVAVLVLRQGKHAWPLALLSGLGFGGGAVSVRAAHVQTGDGLDLALLLGQPSTYLVVGFWLVGMVGYTAALSRGDVGAVTAVFTVSEVLVPGMVGIQLLGDPVRPGWGWVLAIGLALALAGTVVIAKAPPLRPPRIRK